MPKETVFLFTKKFPFGHQETYLFNELPYLVKEFDKVIIIPYDEFEYSENTNRIREDERLTILRINKINNPIGLLEKVKRELMISGILGYELMKGREPGNHFKYRKRNLSQLRQSYNNAISLNRFIAQHSLKDIILYNYWLHGGIVISGMLNKLGAVAYPVISRAHAYDVYHKDWYSLYPDSPYLFLGFETWKVFHTDKIYPISTHALQHFHKLFPQLKEKFEVARLGVPVHEDTTGAANQAEEVILVSCSNINDNKRIYRIPELIALVHKKVKWFHFGKGSDSDTEKLNKEITRYNVESSCTLMGFKPNAEVIEFYKANRVDLFLNLSQIEGIPVSLMEAASFGIPLLATKTVGNPEIVNDENGFLIDVNFDTKSVVDKLNAYFNDVQLVLKKRKASYQTFLEKYNASVNYPAFISSIKHIAHASN